MSADPEPKFIRYPRRQVRRALLRALIAVGLAALTDFHIEGLENLPAAGPLVIVGNHFSFLDPVAVIHITRYPMEFIGGRQAPNAPAAISPAWPSEIWPA